MNSGVPCFLCGRRRFEHLVIGYDRMRASVSDYEYARCAACGLVAMRPLPTAEEIPGFYPDGYEPHAAPRPLRRDKFINRVAIRYFYGVQSLTRPPAVRKALRMLSGRIMRDLVEPRGSCRLLDVGCGAGELLVHHRELGWEVTGIEPDACAVAVCRTNRLQVHQGTVFDAPFDGRQFDTILLSQVIEHLLDPIEALRKVAQWLAPDGRIIVMTPNIRSICFAWFRSCWFPLEAPRHLFLFDPNTIRSLARLAGLRALRVVTRSAPWITYSVHYWKTQGQMLPRDFAARRGIVEASARSMRPYQAWRKLSAPILGLYALAGRGDLMRAEFALPTAS